MKNQIIFEDLGPTDYKKAWDYQETIFSELVGTKSAEGQGKTADQKLLFCEHPHVYTLGKSGKINNLLINENFLAKINATFYKINRGGDITYHGPGQIVGYPIFDLENQQLSIRSYIEKLEESIIRTISDYGLTGIRVQGATGVWLQNEDGTNQRKICAIGVRSSRYITMHGFAFNVNTDLNYFNYINPCGFTDKTVTSLSKELGQIVEFENVKIKLKTTIAQVFNIDYI